MSTSNNRYGDMLEALGDLNSKGYSKSFMITKDGLYCIETKETFKPPNIIIEEFHRFEGATDYEDMAIIYVIVTENGLKGTVIDAFGTYSNPDLGDFLKQVRIK